MSVLNDGRFVFTDKKKNLYIESKIVKNSFSLLYGSTTLAYAFNEEMSAVALVCPRSDAVLETLSTNDDASRSVLKVYRFDEHDLSDLLDEVEIPSASSALWLEPAYLVVSNPNSLTLVLKYSKGKLKVVVRDKNIYPFISLQLLGLLSVDPPLVHLWDVDRDKKVSSLTLRTSRAKKGKEKWFCGSCGSGNFAVIANNNDTAHILYITSNSVRMLSPPISLFTVQQNLHGESDDPVERMHVNPLCIALSSSTMLVGVSGGDKILKLKYKKDGSFKMEDSKRLGSGEELVAIGKNRCLIRKMSEDNDAKVIFTAHSLSAIHSASSIKVGDNQVSVSEIPTAANLVDTSLSESKKRKRRRRNRKEEMISDCQTANEVDRRHIINRNYSFYTPRVAIGVLLAGVAFTLYLKRR